jgi:hypothetical protein
MCEQADTFCKYSWTGFEHFLHLKVSVRAGLLLMFLLMEGMDRRVSRCQDDKTGEQKSGGNRSVAKEKEAGALRRVLHVSR